MDNKTNDSNVIREYFETLSTSQIESQIADLKQERDKYLSESNDLRVLAEGVTRKIELGLSVIGVRNYDAAVDSFKPTADHIRLVAEYGTDTQFNGESDAEIAALLGWPVGENGVTPEQEKRIAELASELKLAQSFINRKALASLE